MSDGGMTLADRLERIEQDIEELATSVRVLQRTLDRFIMIVLTATGVGVGGAAGIQFLPGLF